MLSPFKGLARDKGRMNRSISPDAVSLETATSSLIRSYNTDYRSGD